jgi:hypothetical protein
MLCTVNTVLIVFQLIGNSAIHRCTRGAHLGHTSGKTTWGTPRAYLLMSGQNHLERIQNYELWPCNLLFYKTTISSIIFLASAVLNQYTTGVLNQHTTHIKPNTLIVLYSKHLQFGYFCFF